MKDLDENKETMVDKCLALANIMPRIGMHEDTGFRCSVLGCSVQGAAWQMRHSVHHWNPDQANKKFKKGQLSFPDMLEVEAFVALMLCYYVRHSIDRDTAKTSPYWKCWLVGDDLIPRYNRDTHIFYFD